MMQQKQLARPFGAAIDAATGSRRQGFTLIELIVVVLIIGVMAAIAVPRYADAMDQYRVEAAAKRVQSDLDLARRNARLCSKNCTGFFFVNADIYSFSPMENPDHRNTKFFGTSYYSVDLDETGYDVDLLSADFGGNGIVVFNRYGKPNSDGTVVVQAGGHQKTIILDAVTGRVTIQ